MFVLGGLLALVAAQTSGRPLDAESREAVLARLVDPAATREELRHAAGALRPLAEGTTSAEVEALGRALRIARTSAKTPTSECWRPLSADACVVWVDECLSRAALIAYAAGALGSRAGPLADEAVALLDSSDLSAKPLTRRLLASIGHPRGLEELRQLLRRSTSDCTREAGMLLKLMPSVSPTAQPEMMAALDTSARVRRSLAAGVAAKREPWAVPVTLQLLRDADYSVRREAVSGAALHWPPDASVVAALGFAARCDVAGVVRDEAIRLLYVHGVKPAPVTCPKPLGHAFRRVVTAPAVALVLRDAPAPAPPSKDCEAAAGRRDALGIVNGHCLFTGDRGEWGSELLLFDHGSARSIGEDSLLHASAVLSWGDDIVVISRWTPGLYRISRDAGRTWKIEDLFELPSEPVAWGVANDTLFIALSGGASSNPCADATGEVIYAVAHDLSVSLVESETTACVWAPAADGGPARPSP